MWSNFRFFEIFHYLCNQKERTPPVILHTLKKAHFPERFLMTVSANCKKYYFSTGIDPWREWLEFIPLSGWSKHRKALSGIKSQQIKLNDG